MNRTPILFLNVLVIAACGLIYELLAGTVASYVLGDSVTQFSLIIGLYLSALGIGAWLSRFLDRDLAARFIDVELAVALIGGLSAPLLFLGFSRLAWFQLFLYSVVLVIGTLVGLELPILMRILKEQLDFKELVSRVLSFDYIGSLIAAVLFPMFLVPRLGLVRTSIAFGLLNAAVGLYGTWLLKPLLRGVKVLRIRAVIVFVILIVAMFRADDLTTLAEDELYADDIVFSASSQYQRILITRNAAGFQLFLNGNLQFSSADEYRYHEALVHPAIAASAMPRRVLILGGGDGLALREVLKYRAVEHVTLVDLDPAMTHLFTTHPILSRLNEHAFSSPKVRVVNADAFVWLDQNADMYDFAVVDFPDPNNYGVGKLYTTAFYRLLARHLSRHGLAVVQSTSPLFARRSFWSIAETLREAGFATRPYHVYVPSFGEWGFILVGREGMAAYEPPTALPAGLRYLTVRELAPMFDFPLDMQRVAVDANHLDDQVLVRYYADEVERTSR